VNNAIDIKYQPVSTLKADILNMRTSREILFQYFNVLMNKISTLT